MCAHIVEMVTAIISGIITLGFVIGAIVALCTGNVPVAAELAVDAGLGLYETIKSTIKAVGLAKYANFIMFTHDVLIVC